MVKCIAFTEPCVERRVFFIQKTGGVHHRRESVRSADMTPAEPAKNRRYIDPRGKTDRFSRGDLFVNCKMKSETPDFYYRE